MIIVDNFAKRELHNLWTKNILKILEDITFIISASTPEVTIL